MLSRSWQTGSVLGQVLSLAADSSALAFTSCFAEHETCQRWNLCSSRASSECVCFPGHASGSLSFPVCVIIAFFKKSPYPRKPPKFHWAFLLKLQPVCYCLNWVFLFAPGSSALASWLSLFLRHVKPLHPDRAQVRWNKGHHCSRPSGKPQSGQKEAQFLGKKVTVLPLKPAPTLAHGSSLRCAAREVGHE